MKAECPLCLVPLAGKALVCARCGLPWRAPSPRAIRVEAGPRFSSQSMAFRPRLGDVLATLGAMTLATPVATALFAGAFDGEWWSGRVLGSELLWQLIAVLVLLFTALACLRLFSHAAELGARLIAPRKLADGGDVLQVRAGGLRARGRAEVRVAKLDLREVVLEPHEGGYLHDICIVHRTGLALLLATELPRETAQRLGTRVASWLDTPEPGALDYRGSLRGARRSFGQSPGPAGGV